MLDIVQPIDLFVHNNNSDNKISNGNLYLCQPHTVIQLVEVAPPPPRRISSVINSSSAGSSSYSSTASSYDEEEDDEEEEEEEEVCESYCSSDDEMDVCEGGACTSSPASNSHSDSFSSKMKRILVWRELSDAPLAVLFFHLTLKLTSSALLLQSSHSSKRSRSQASSHSVSSMRSISSSELQMHSCPACDAFFPTEQSLRQHGRDAQVNEACFVAVEYAFEQ
ncbi:hypothetical protein CVT24_011379 [Panaeolus cyanescens]|uniref:Uncharacterized protein n=1 Tax=Panaeolus cyanescens TaxID=181874 RepID=A0A409VG38_9AGAR|nr:hypothetical protein CVT24_011379 [Panaeolus cyanescens]